MRCILSPHKFTLGNAGINKGLLAFLPVAFTVIWVCSCPLFTAHPPVSVLDFLVDCIAHSNECVEDCRIPCGSGILSVHTAARCSPAGFRNGAHVHDVPYLEHNEWYHTAVLPKLGRHQLREFTHYMYPSFVACQKLKVKSTSPRRGSLQRPGFASALPQAPLAPSSWECALSCVPAACWYIRTLQLMNSPISPKPAPPNWSKQVFHIRTLVPSNWATPRLPNPPPLANKSIEARQKRLSKKWAFVRNNEFYFF